MEHPTNVLAGPVETRTVAILARLPTYYIPKVVMVISTTEDAPFYFVLGTMFPDAKIYVNSSKPITKNELEHAPHFEMVRAGNKVGQYDLLILSFRSAPKNAKEVMARVIERRPRYILCVGCDNGFIEKYLYTYQIGRASCRERV